MRKRKKEREKEGESEEERLFSASLFSKIEI